MNLVKHTRPVVLKLESRKDLMCEFKSNLYLIPSPYPDFVVQVDDIVREPAENEDPKDNNWSLESLQLLAQSG